MSGKILIPVSGDGIDTSDATIAPNTVLQGQIGYGKDGKIIGELGQQSKTVTPTSETQVIIPDSGYLLSEVNINSVPTEEITVTPSETTQTILPSVGKWLSKIIVNAISKTFVGSGIARQAAKTVTPSESAQTAVASGVYTTGAVTVAGDADLTAGNIKSGVNIFGKAGTFTSDATAKADYIMSGYTAYVNGNKVTGSMKRSQEIDTVNWSSTNTSKVRKIDVTPGMQTNSDGVKRICYQMRVTGYNYIGDWEGFGIAADKFGTASVGQVLTGNTFTSQNGVKITGTMPSQAAKTVTAGTSNVSAGVKGKYMAGEITVAPTPSETKSASPSTSAQTITPTSGKLLKSVSISAIPTETKTVTPTKSAQTVTPTSGKYLTKVTVNGYGTKYNLATTGSSSDYITIASTSPGTQILSINNRKDCSIAIQVLNDGYVEGIHYFSFESGENITCAQYCEKISTGNKTYAAFLIFVSAEGNIIKAYARTTSDAAKSGIQIRVLGTKNFTPA